MTDKRVQGVPETTHALDALADDVGDLTRVNEAIAAAIIPDVRPRTPVRTGALAGSWEARGTKDRAEIVSALAYSVPLEFGSATVDAYAMVRTAVDANAGKAEDMYRDEMHRLAAARDFGWQG